VKKRAPTRQAPSRSRGGGRAPRPADGEYRDFVADQLGGLGGVEMRAMFGGLGIYLDGTFFAIVHKSRLFFRVGPGTVGGYQSRGMKPFSPYGKPMAGYYEVPSEVQEDGAELRRWARASARGAGRARAARVRSRPAARSRTGRP
jgi:DNA transformation protein